MTDYFLQSTNACSGQSIDKTQRAMGADLCDQHAPVLLFVKASYLAHAARRHDHQQRLD